MKSKCKGCHSCPANDQKVCEAGVVPYLSETESCPCLNCIVKCMCEVTCDEFREYIRQYFRYKEMEAC